MRKSYIKCNSVALVLFNIVFWISNYYPRHIIERSSRAPMAITINAVLFLIQFILLFIFFDKDVELFEMKSSKKRICFRSVILKFLLLFSVQLLFECLISYLEVNYGINTYVVRNLLILAVWIIDYLILTCSSGHKTNFRKTQRIIVICVIIMSVICIFADSIMVADFKKCCAKYTENSYRLNAIQTNYEFLHSIVTFFFDSFIACALVVFHASRIERFDVDSDKISNGCRFTARIWIMILVSVGLLAIKATVFPPSFSKSVDASIVTSYSYVEDQTFDNHLFEPKFYRFDDNLEPKLYYGFSRVTILCDNKRLKSFSTPFVDVAEGFTKYDVDGRNVSVYGNSAICYIENDVPHVVLFEDIHKLKNNPVITGVCKKLIGEGNVIVFEYAVEYLKKYDPNFILPYIIRYSNGEFNTLELNMLDEVEYRLDYILNIANSAK